MRLQTERVGLQDDIQRNVACCADLFEVMARSEARLGASAFFMMDENFLLYKRRALELLANARRMVPDALTKSGISLGMGEEWDEVLVCMRDLRRSDVNLLTLGQYLRPSAGHLPVARYYTPEEFAELREIGLDMGFTHVQSSPLTRSSYHAWEQLEAAEAAR